MKNIPLTMVRQHLNDIPQYPFPSPFRVRNFKPGDERSWVKIETSVGEFADEDAALKHFDKEFGSHVHEMKSRCLFIENGDGEAIGTTTAWYGALRDEERIGRIHWVAIRPEYQGQKLAKPLLGAALQVLDQYHPQAYLTTQTTSFKAIQMYLDFGFEPLLHAPGCMEGWTLLESVLNRKIIK
ncbi:GNAT family N-acetyltransferase [Paenibacillus dokdonensis]|uniref:GNAT family N-acetyltransferase n=2 Tax=Paenibacillus dokdonensis TaxID=2567944 RepID=A0ABU6GSU6_9BACL|nr:GNAT family N-acetyltransferase [Paenibacillus dokdonensis]MEC0242837.1 GNAT family N-acetyltransferase [Paenibacillus dokdonensis]